MDGMMTNRLVTDGLMTDGLLVDGLKNRFMIDS